MDPKKRPESVTTAKMYQEYRRAKEAPVQRTMFPKLHGKPRVPVMVWVLIAGIVIGAAAWAIVALSRRGTVSPASPVAGYYSMDQALMGEGSGNVRLNGAEVTLSGQDTVIRLRFDNGIPAYSISSLYDPARMVVKLTGLTGWDHLSRLGWEQQSLIMGMFMHTVGAQGECGVYFQLTRNVGFRVVEDNTSLLIYLRPLETTVSPGYYVTLNAYEAYTLGMFATDDFTPVLCTDGASITLISGRFETQVEADASSQELNQKLTSILPGVACQVVQLSGNEAPPLSDAAERAMLSSVEVYRPINGKGTSWLWTSSGRFMGWMPDHKRALFSRSINAPSASGGSYSELWLYNLDGKAQRLLDIEFSSLLSAKFTADGSALAFIESTDSENLLYYYSLTSGAFTSLSNQIGGQTSGFDFDSDGLLYMVGGFDDVALMSWNPGKTGGDAVKLLEDEPGLVGSLEVGSTTYSPGKLFISDGMNATYSFDLAGRTRARLTIGGDFELSPDGHYMLLKVYDDTLASDTYTGLKLRDMQTGAERAIMSGEPVCNSCWASDGSRVYYLTYNVDPATQSDFPTILNSFTVSTGAVTQLGLIKSYEIYAGAGASEITFMYTYQNSLGSYLPAAFRMTLE